MQIMEASMEGQDLLMVFLLMGEFLGMEVIKVTIVAMEAWILQ